jgi:hypothetical protein
MATIDRWFVAAIAAGLGCVGGAKAPSMGPIELASGPTRHGATPMIAVTAAGERILSWVADDSVTGREALFVAADSVITVLRDSLGGIEPHGEAPPQMVAAPDGDLYSLYTVGKEVPGARFPRSALRFSRSEDGGRTWSAPISVNEGERFGSHNFHALLAGRGGVVHAAWLSADRGRSAVWLRSSADGGRSWDTARAIDSTEACPCCRTGLGLGPDGRLYVSWRKVFDGNVRDVVVMRSTNGGSSWEPPVRPREDGWVIAGCPHAGPSLQVAPDGSVHIAWWTGKAGEAGVYYGRSTDGGETFAVTPIAVGPRSAPAHVQLAVTSNWTAVAWDDGLGPNPRVLVRLALAGRAFGAAVQVSGSGAATFPVLGAIRDTLVVAWTEKGTAAHHADMSARPDMSKPGATMPLPRVGASDIFFRRVPVSALAAR